MARGCRDANFERRRRRKRKGVQQIKATCRSMIGLLDFRPIIQRHVTRVRSLTSCVELEKFDTTVSNLSSSTHVWCRTSKVRHTCEIIKVTYIGNLKRKYCDNLNIKLVCSSKKALLEKVNWQWE